MIACVGFFLVFSLASLALFLASGFQLQVPVIETLLFLGSSLALSSGVAQLHGLVSPLDARRRAALGIVGGATLVLMWRSGTPMVLATLVLGSLAIVRAATEPRWALRVAAFSAAVLLWWSGVQYLNYVLLSARSDSLVDPALRSIDLAIYQRLAPSLDYVHLFPLVRDRHLFKWLENGYLSLVAQTFIVLMATVDRPEFTRRFLLTGFAAHLIAMAVFVIAPAVGPTLYYADAFDPSYAGTVTGAAIHAMRVDYLSIASGGQPVTGYGYFIALPSLHAALSTLCLMAVRREAFLVGFLAVPNLLLVLSTVLLGQHYVIDTLVGIALGVGLGVPLTGDLNRSARRSKRPPNQDPALDDTAVRFGDQRTLKAPTARH